MDISRRKALKTISKTAVVASAGLLFGGQISQALSKEQKLVLFYSSKYGATSDISNWIAQGVSQPIQVINITNTEHVNAVFSVKGSYILGSAVYKEQPMLAMQEFVALHREKLDGNTIASFVVCGTQPDSDKNVKRIEGYLSKLNAPLTQKPSLTRQFGGRLVVEKLTPDDRAMLERFYTKVLSKPLVDWDRMNREEVMRMAQAVSFL